MDIGETQDMVVVSNTITDATGEDQLSTSATTHMDDTKTKTLNTFEDLLEAVGTNGRWNITIILTCAFGKYMPMSLLKLTNIHSRQVGLKKNLFVNRSDRKLKV